MSSDERGRTVVLPLRSTQNEVTPAELVANGEAVTVSWSPLSRTDIWSRWAAPLRGAAGLSQHLGQILKAAEPAATGQMLFRVVTPNGEPLRALVPAVGGGFRGMVRSGTQISGHAKLIPVGSAGAGVAGAAALAPVIAVAALAVGAEMLAQHQQNLKLAAIAASVRTLTEEVQDNHEATIVSGEQAFHESALALASLGHVPESAGLGPARHGVRQLRNQSLQWLDRWEEGASQLKRRKGGGFSTSDVVQVLGGRSRKDTSEGWSEFPRRVGVLYRALALDSRAAVLTQSEVALATGDRRSVQDLQAELQRQLDINAGHQDRMRELLWRLLEEPVTYGLPAKPNAAARAAEVQGMLHRLVASLSRAPNAVPVLDAQNRQVLEVVRDDDGKLELLQARDT